MARRALDTNVSERALREICLEGFRIAVQETVNVKNAGGAAGKEAVQLYLTAPAMKLDKPPKELKAFAKTRPLAPSETQTLTFVLDSRSLASS
jgi:beta-glucosidase